MVSGIKIVTAAFVPVSDEGLDDEDDEHVPENNNFNDHYNEVSDYSDSK